MNVTHKGMTKGLAAALKVAGGAKGLAIAVGLSKQAIYKWNRIPAERVVEVEKATGIPREELRPDLYRVK